MRVGLPLPFREQRSENKRKTKEVSMTRRIARIGAVMALLTVLLLAGPVHAEQEKISFGSVNWPGVTVKTHVVSEICKALGYRTEINQLQVPATFKALSMGQLDVFMGTWLPTQKNYVDPYLEKEQMVLLTVNLDDTKYKNAVPEYVWDAGVRSMEDLDRPEFREKFDRNGDRTPEFYGIEPGNDGNKVVIDAIENDTYGLGDWDLVPSSTSGMLSQVKKAAQEKEWIVFLGWEPHWMNLEWDLKYLKDPKHIWGKPGSTRVLTAVRTGLQSDAPNLCEMLEQIKIEPDWQSAWIRGYSQKGKAPDRVAREWIAANKDVVKKWVVGVTTRDGSRDAATVVEESF
jgi:glycine betaine/proline transport system substrate-binding protein